MEQARVHHDIPVLIKGKNSDGKAYAERTVAENMTRGGVFIRTLQPMETGQTFRIYPADDGSRAVAKAEVVWVRPQGDEGTSGIGAKLVGSNRHWVNFLVENSMPVDDNTGEDFDDDDNFEDDEEYGDVD